MTEAGADRRAPGEGSLGRTVDGSNGYLPEAPRRQDHRARAVGISGHRLRGDQGEWNAASLRDHDAEHPPRGERGRKDPAAGRAARPVLRPDHELPRHRRRASAAPPAGRSVQPSNRAPRPGCRARRGSHPWGGSGIGDPSGLRCRAAAAGGLCTPAARHREDARGAANGAGRASVPTRWVRIPRDARRQGDLLPREQRVTAGLQPPPCGGGRCGSRRSWA